MTIVVALVAFGQCGRRGRHAFDEKDIVSAAEVLTVRQSSTGY